ncbi:SDR family oxidoreductase [Halalkalibacterium halodurans]|jgi:NAD(P)-dependent dehydrogenase (short-subunit alcohol dehydrogenase family)|uniref:Short-chain dehydrogenase n=1 Tax=Halalkalibacterium halodurans TaxID=86665 RepID=A0A0M0KE95_ALKHA|nr:SDR family oxidoreductase [Halalkalibacterium halodurans]TPE68842.1 SDR family oxidoreductase [Halalkalibacterium halodurans]
MENRRIVIITGANSGIGKEAAQRFANEGDHVIMACRNIAFSRKVQHDIIAASGNDHVDLLELDVSSFASIRTFCTTFNSQYKRLDILIHNAAYFNHGEPYRLSPDGIELTFATNVFGPYLLTSLLRDRLKQSEDPRILHAGSNIIKHFFDPKQTFDLDLLQENHGTKSYSVYKMYCQSKMALMLLTFQMAEVFADDGIKVNALQINGAKMSKRTIQKVKPWWRPIAWGQNLFFPPPSYMADKYFTICTSDKYKQTTGKLFNDKLEIMEPSPTHYPGFFKQMKLLLGSNVYPAYENTNIREKLWALCKELVGE